MRAAGLEGNMQKQDEYILEINHITKSFKEPSAVLSGRKREKKVLDGVSFSVRQGEAYGLAGASGCGKSTLARTVMGAYRPEEGEIRVCGKRVDHLRRNQRKEMYGEIQMIFQDSYSSLNPSMTVKRTIEEPMAVRKMYGKAQRRERACTILEQMGFERKDLERYPHEFSGGQRQKIALARALAVNPRMLICDEPLASLDLLTKSQLLELLMQIRGEQGMSLLYISHDMGELKRICSRMGIMKEGKIAEERRII